MVTRTPESSAYPLRAVDRVCDILDILANSADGATLAEVAESARLPKSSTFRYLSALAARRYVERDPESGTYRLGVAFRPQHTRALDELIDLARPALERLRDQLEETTNLGVLDGTFVAHAVVAESPHMMRLAARVGDRGYVHATALGKAMCATMPDDRVRSILEAAGMPRLTEATIVDPDEYLRELEKVRSDGYALDDNESQPSGRSVAVAIDGLGFPAAISVSAPAHRLPLEDSDRVIRKLRKLARSLSRQLRGRDADHAAATGASDGPTRRACGLLSLTRRRPGRGATRRAGPGAPSARCAGGSGRAPRR
jgi:IclR family acetate operon transcriptional repressor